MICPKCYAEYLDHIQECGDCKVPLVDACLIDLPIPEMTWKSLPPFQGKVYANMAAEILDENNIPNYLKMDWATSAFNINGANIPGEVVRIFVPETSMEKASDLVLSIIGESN
tara:strand:+ start:3574 stop:3912 length:339 start_codon:yes stop_codon:yes gene_type:complete